LATKIGEEKGKKNPIKAIGDKNRWGEGKNESNRAIDHKIEIGKG
jgi:hypothetical protein